MQVRPYVPEDRAAAVAFAQRIAADNSGRGFPIPDRQIFDYRHESRLTEKIVVVDEEGVHGGLDLRHDLFYIDNEETWLGYYKYPISEGIVNRRYAFVAIQLQQAIQKHVEYVYGIGGGGVRSTTMQVLLRSGWSAGEIPFYFYLNHPTNCFHKLPSLQRSPLRKALARAASQSGLGWAGIKSTQYLRSLLGRKTLRSASYEVVAEFGEWIDELFDRCRPQYRMVASRDSNVVRKMFPVASNLQRGIVYSRGELVGWFVVVAPMLNKQSYFGELSVGLIADFFACPRHATEVIAAATDYLRRRQVDLVVCNASHSAWRQALGKCGYFRGPSNFPFVCSPRLEARLAPFPKILESAHLTRTDGDGLEPFLASAIPARGQLAH
jgi:hypothetical protein